MADSAKIFPINIEEEMRRSYIDYAMSVIVQRALPDARDGLKPVHRRILFAMHEMGNTPDRPYKKSARIVGDVLGRYHPHGDVAVYDAMARLAQDFSTRYQLVDGHGNFGSVDGDPPAAMRYTEVRLSRISLELLRDIEKETVDFIPNFDESLQEPVVLPSRFPNLLVNGSSGIAVGMATNIPPHNLGEVIDGVVHLIDHPEATARDLTAIVRGPDFPTGGLLLGRDGIMSAYETGRGSITMRGVATIEPMQNGRMRILISELPYLVNKAKMIERIAELVRERKVEGISDLRDESDRTGLRVVVELRRDANPGVVLNQLYKFTSLQQNFGVIMLALVNGRPRVLTLRDALHHYLQHQKDVIVRRSAYELRKAEERAHILQGLLIALDSLDAVIKLIRESPDVEAARTGLMSGFELSEKQAQAILDLRLQRLTALERNKIQSEFDELQGTIAYLRAVLGSDQLVLDMVKREILEIKARFADPRRSKIVPRPDEFSDEDLIAEEDVVVSLTHQGYIKRHPLTSFRSQRRGGRGITGMHTKEEDFLEHLFVTTTHHQVLFFTNRGKVYRLKVHEIPEASRIAKGMAIVNLLNLTGGEKITAVIPTPEDVEGGFLIMATRSGTVKRTAVEGFKGIRSDGLIAIALTEDDELIGVRYTTGHEDILLVTRVGRAIRFPEADVRSMGRTARGVRGILLGKRDQVVTMEVVKDDSDLLVVSENGYGKRSALKDYRRTGRGGKGIRAIGVSERNGVIAGVRVVQDEDEVMLISSSGILIRLPVHGIPRQGRTASGVTVMRLEAGDSVGALAAFEGKEGEDL